MAALDSIRNNTVVIPGFVPLDATMPRRRFRDLTGETFGKLTVLKYAGRRHDPGGTKLYWICRCKCGRLTLAKGDNLISRADSITCGCSQSKYNWRRRTKSMKAHPLYGIWAGIVLRTQKYLEYILRGMCDGFMDFDHFVAVIGPRPTHKHTVDRADNNGGYWCGSCQECLSLGRPRNVRWATRQEQNNNRGDNRRITYQGQTKTLAEWGRTIGIRGGRIAARLDAGWSIRDAMRTPKLKNQSRNPVVIDELTQQECARLYRSGKTLTELASLYGCDRHTVANVLRRLGVELRRRSDWMKVGLSRKRRHRQRSLKLT